MVGFESWYWYKFNQRNFIFEVIIIKPVNLFNITYLKIVINQIKSGRNETKKNETNSVFNQIGILDFTELNFPLA